MPTPNLIVQRRELARSFREIHRQNEQSLDAVQAAREREIAAAEQKRLATCREFDDRLMQFLELEKIARSKLKVMNSIVFDDVGAASPQKSITGPAQALAECKSEIELVLAKLAYEPVRLTFVTVPSDVDTTAVVKKLNALISDRKYEKCPKPGDPITCSLELAGKIIVEMESLGIKAELVA